MKRFDAKRLVNSSNNVAGPGRGMLHSPKTKNSTIPANVVPNVDSSLSSSENLVGGLRSQRWATECGFQLQDFASPWNCEWAPRPPLPGGLFSKELGLASESVRRSDGSSAVQTASLQRRRDLRAFSNSSAVARDKQCFRQEQMADTEGNGREDCFSSISSISELTDVFNKHPLDEPSGVTPFPTEFAFSTPLAERAGLFEDSANHVLAAAAAGVGAHVRNSRGQASTTKGRNESTC